MSGLALATALLLTAQALPPELNQREDRRGFDPVLPAGIVPAVKRAIEAELDPNRGTRNAVEILKAEQRRVSGDRELEMAVQVRLATVVLRATFSGNEKVEKSVALQQALSTYAKLDVTDPGLAAWLERALEATPAAKAAFDKSGRKLEVAVLTRGEGLDANAFASRMGTLVALSGLKYVKASPKDASYLLKLSADHVRAPGEVPTVRVMLELGRGGAKPFKRTLFRTVEAKNPEVAVAAAVEWLARMGARDLVFHFAAEHGLPAAVPLGPNDGGHGGHPH